MANEMANQLKWWQKRLGGVGPWIVEEIPVHDQAHFDEAFGYVICTTWGREIFLGIEDAPITFWTGGRIPKEYSGKNGDQLLVEQGILPIGIGGGILDEHGTNAPSCAHVAAEVLGVANRPELQKILTFCKRVDQDGKSMPFDIHSLLNDLWDDCKTEDDLSKSFDWAVDGIKAHIRGQFSFFKCQSEFEKTGKIIRGPANIALVESDNRKMNKWLRWQYKDDVSIIIQKNRTGNAVIFTCPEMNGLNMDDLARTVRIAELMKRQILLPTWQELESAEAGVRCEWWYYNKKNKGQLLNGSLTAPEVEPTILSLEEIAGAVALACAPFYDPCKNEKCSGRRCPKYSIGFKACRQKRFEIFHKDKQKK